MNNSQIKTIVSKVQDDNVSVVKIEWMGLDLILRNMATTVEFLEDALKNGIGVTRAQQSFNVLDHLVPEGAYGSESSEFKLIPVPETYRTLPHVKGFGRIQAELCETGTLNPTPSDPRHFLKRMVEKLDGMGLRAKCAMEAEFYLLDSSRGEPVIDGKLMDSLGIDRLSGFLQEVSETLIEMGIKVEHIKKEYGGSQFEITYRYDDPLKTADNFIVLKNVIKSLAYARNMIASFMPKVGNEFPGSGLHIHLSLFDKEGSKNVFFDGSDAFGSNFSDLGYNFIGGLLNHMEALCAFENPLSNSYKRLIPGSWAPAHISYGYDHRGVAVRIPSTAPGDIMATRIELRLPDCSANPHIALGAMIAAGIDGMEKKTEPVSRLNYEPAKLSESELKKRGVERLPTTLIEAIHAAEEDHVLRGIIGELLYDEYLKVRKSEWEDYYRNVDSWEVNRFLEPI